MKTAIIALAMIAAIAAHAGEAEEEQKRVHAEAAFRCAALAYYFNDLAEQERLETLGMKVAMSLAEKPFLKGTLPAELTIDLDTTARVLLGVKIGVMRTQGYWSVAQELYKPTTPEDYTTRVPREARSLYVRANCRLIN